MFTHPRSLLVLAGLVLSAASLRADFSGAYDTGAAGAYNLVNGASTGFGAWTGLLSTGGTGGSGSVNTNSAPGSLTLSATGNAEMGMGTLLFSAPSFAEAGVVSFDFSGSLSVLLDGQAQAATGSSYSFAVETGQTLAFQISAMGTQGFMMMMPGGIDPIMMTPIMTPTWFPGSPMSNTATIFNFSAPAAVPEPSAFAALAGGLALVGATLRRRRR